HEHRHIESSLQDIASTIDDRISYYTASVASSVVDYPVEYGRRYHAFRPGSYLFPNDEQEMDRLDLSHSLMVKMQGNRLFLAPLEKEKIRRILDIGTGTGIWAVEMGDIFQDAEVIGKDLSAIQPSWAPLNVKFEIDDVESPWVDTAEFDYIMCRYMVASIKDWPVLVLNIFDHVNPGGWAEFQDINVDHYSEDGSLTDNNPFHKWAAALNKATEIIDALRTFCGVLGWTKEDALAHVAEVRRELKSGKFHSMFDFLAATPNITPEPNPPNTSPELTPEKHRRMDTSSGPSSSFSAAHYFPARRRVWQACTNCRARKTRCDAAKPKCSLCMSQNVECVYRDSNQPRIEQNTRILLERIQMLEDRLFASPVFSSPQQQQQQQPVSTPSPQATRQQQPATPGSGAEPVQQQDGTGHDNDGQIPIPLSHTANANHVFEWPIVRQLLSETEPAALPPRPAMPGGVRSTEATDIFFRETPDQNRTSSRPPESWRLFRDRGLPVSVDAADRYREVVHEYFAEMNAFFPLLSLDDVMATLDEVIRRERTASEEDEIPDVSPARYCLLLLVLCLGCFVCTGEYRISLDEVAGRDGGQHPQSLGSGFFRECPGIDGRLWDKARLLLGFISSETTLEAAQCTMLAGLYMGANGRVADSFHWAHATAVKCEALARRAVISTDGTDRFSDAFRRLFWVSLIYEGDFVSEISITLPSGITRYEDVVPYPAPETPKHRQEHAAAFSSSTDQATTLTATSFYRTEELVAFQVSTNAAIRRFLNRVNSVVYDSKDQFRMTRANYANWLLRITEDLWSYHGALYRNLPDFLLTSQPRRRPGDQDSSVGGGSPATPGIIRLEELGNNPWNVLRLKGRYYAGQYIIHRPFLEYVLLNVAHFETHPCKEAILDRCRMCLEGCRGFIDVFDIDPANSVTCLFAGGMVTFTMVIILRVATMCPVFRDILPADIEQAMFGGTRNLRRFSISVKEFEWHLGVLERLEASCKNRMAM
ncbi:C6 finger domain-containing protein, partial [Colletotrichum sojae]